MPGSCYVGVVLVPRTLNGLNQLVSVAASRLGEALSVFTAYGDVEVGYTSEKICATIIPTPAPILTPTPVQREPAAQSTPAPP